MENNNPKRSISYTDADSAFPVYVFMKIKDASQENSFAINYLFLSFYKVFPIDEIHQTEYDYKRGY